METSAKTYSIAGHRIRVVLASPWTFKHLTPEQETLVKTLRGGGDLGIRPVPADKQEELAGNETAMGRVEMTRERWETMDLQERDAFRHDLDMLQYAPFEVADDGDALFTLTVGGEEPDYLRDLEKLDPVVSVDENLPIYYGYRIEGRTVYSFYPVQDRCAGVFVLENGFRSGHYYPRKGFGARTTQMQVNTSLMIAYTFATAGLQTLLLHASVVRHEGAAALFFGVSGTGKSTHSRLWLEHVPDTDLLNDDNPVIRFAPDGTPTVYGSPWSGKTLCYRNVQSPIRALVRLEQDPENAIERLASLNAYASVIAAVSTIRWDSRVMDLLVPTVEKAVTHIPCFRLRCRPDADAVRVCREAIES